MDLQLKLQIITFTVLRISISVMNSPVPEHCTFLDHSTAREKVSQAFLIIIYKMIERKAGQKMSLASSRYDSKSLQLFAKPPNIF